MSKFYVVWRGHTPGIYTTWEDCKAEVHGVYGAKYKSYKTRLEAEAAYRDGPTSAPMLPGLFNTPATTTKANSQHVYPSIAVDAACSGNPGVTEYRCVDTQTGEVLFHPPALALGTNNIGEFLGLVHALDYLQKANKTLPIYTDSKTAMAWVKQKKIKSTFPDTPETAPTWDQVRAAEAWLHNNPISCPILKWETQDWGEIPADFGRK